VESCPKRTGLQHYRRVDDGNNFFDSPEGTQKRCLLEILSDPARFCGTATAKNAFNQTKAEFLPILVSGQGPAQRESERVQGVCLAEWMRRSWNVLVRLSSQTKETLPMQKEESPPTTFAAFSRMHKARVPCFSCSKFAMRK
jgi:hypothetical protein